MHVFPLESESVQSPKQRNLRASWRILLLLVWASWWGGLSFYAIVVVPVGTEEIGSVEQGFITQRVSQWHNALTGLFILILLIEAAWRRSIGLCIVGAMLTIIDIALLVDHAKLTGMMDFKLHTVPSSFYDQHAVYLWIVAVEWLLGLTIPIWIIASNAEINLKFLNRKHRRFATDAKSAEDFMISSKTAQ